MSHKAGRDFFDVKREWSKQKDFILDQYLTPYLAKITKAGRPVMVVDGFSGPGRFSDGEPGSPLLICEALRTARNRTLQGDFRATLVERDPVLFTRLSAIVNPFRDFVDLREGAFESLLPELERACEEYNLFLYLDPFTVSSLSWESLDRIFRQIDRVKSVEILLNFNVMALGRAACVALNKKFSQSPPDEEQLEGETSGTTQMLDAVLGGSWWQVPFKDAATFTLACDALIFGYLSKMRARFAEVCHHEIKERHAHAIPKYVLVFGSRHSDALELMNDAMAKSLGMQATIESPGSTLFEMRPDSLVPSADGLIETIKAVSSEKRSRGEVMLSVIRRDFGRFSNKAIRGKIEELLKNKKMASETGSSRINDQTLVWWVAK